MPIALTVADLLAPGAPLEQATVLAGRDALHNPVNWAISLRPYPPAIPPVRGGEIALASTETLAPHDPPISLGDVVRQLAALGSAAAAYRGIVAAEALAVAEEVALPLVLLPPDASLPEVEQAIMRECALFQARREVMSPPGVHSWIESLFGGRITSGAELENIATGQDAALSPLYAVAWAIPQRGSGMSPADFAQKAAATVAAAGRKRNSKLAVQAFDDGLAVLVPPGATDELAPALSGVPFACGLGSERPVLEAPISLSEAKLAAVAAAHQPAGGFAYFERLGADRLLLVLRRDNRVELEAFVRTTLGPLIDHDKRAASPLLPTVASFVSHGGRLRETSADIFVHRNTLAYRLDRAAALLGSDLKDPVTRLAVELALRALPLLED